MPMPRLNKAYICVYYRLSSLSFSCLLLLLWHSPKEKAATVVGAPLWYYSSPGWKGKAFFAAGNGQLYGVVVLLLILTSFSKE